MNAWPLLPELHPPCITMVYANIKTNTKSWGQRAGNLYDLAAQASDCSKHSVSESFFLLLALFDVSESDYISVWSSQSHICDCEPLLCFLRLKWPASDRWPQGLHQGKSKYCCHSNMTLLQVYKKSFLSKRFGWTIFEKWMWTMYAHSTVVTFNYDYHTFPTYLFSN